MVDGRCVAIKDARLLSQSSSHLVSTATGFKRMVTSSDTTLTATGTKAIKTCIESRTISTHRKSTTTKSPNHIHHNKQTHRTTHLHQKQCGHFQLFYPGFQGYYQGYPVYPSSSNPFPGWTSSLERRTNPRSRYGKQTHLGDGMNHHDVISFSLTNAKEPSDETLIVMNPVRDYHFKGLQTGRLEALFEELSQLQESRVGQLDVAFEECEMRQMTLDTLAEELQRRKQWSGDDDGEDGEGGKEDE